MKKLLFASLFVLVSLPAVGQVRFGVRAGILDSEPMIGAELVYPIGGDFVINPNLEFSTDLFAANADAHYDFDITRNASFWLGAGLAFVNPDEGDLDGGVNLLAGLGARRGRYYPYVQLKHTSAGDIDDFTSLAAGIRF